MKKTNIVVIMFVGISLTFLLCSCNSKNKGANVVLPSFNLLLSDSTTHFNTKDAKRGVPVALLYFSPDCEHCQQETENIIKNIGSLKNVQFYFVTIDPFENMRTFNSYYNLTKYENIKVGKDEQYFFLRHFKGAFPPYMVLYDKNKVQRQIFQGEVNPGDLIAAINNL